CSNILWRCPVNYLRQLLIIFRFPEYLTIDCFLLANLHLFVLYDTRCYFLLLAKPLRQYEPLEIRNWFLRLKATSSDLRFPADRLHIVLVVPLRLYILRAFVFYDW